MAGASLFSGNGAIRHTSELSALVRIAKGIELRTTYTGQGETTTWASILAPWKGEIREALNIEIASAYDDCRDGGATPCYRHRRIIKFVKGADPAYEDIVLTRSGTMLTKDAPLKAIDANEVKRGHFFEGKYVFTAD